MRVPLGFCFPAKLGGAWFLPFPWLNFQDRLTDHERWKSKGKDVPVAVDVKEEVRGANWQRELVPLSVCHPVWKGLCPGLPVMYVMIPDLIPQTTALQFKIAICGATKNWFYFSSRHHRHNQSLILTSLQPLYSESKISEMQHNELHNPKSIGPHGTQFTLLVTHLEPLKWY